jgi:hypothetical protein
MKSAKEWDEYINGISFDVLPDLVPFIEAIQRDALESVLRCGPEPSGKRTDWDDGYDTACRHWQQDIDILRSRISPTSSPPAGQTAGT